MTLDELAWAPPLLSDPGGTPQSILICFRRDPITHVQLRQQRTDPRPQKGKPISTHGISILPWALNRHPGVLCNSSNPRRPGRVRAGLRPLLTCVLVQLVGRVALRLKDPNDDDVVSILQELLDLLEGQDLLGGRPGLLDHVVDDPWEQSTRLSGAWGFGGTGSSPHQAQRRRPYRIFPVGHCNRKPSPCGRSSGSGSRRRRTSWRGLSPLWRRPSPGGSGESAYSAPWQPFHTRGPVSCSVHTCESERLSGACSRVDAASQLREVHTSSLHSWVTSRDPPSQRCP